MRFFLSPKLKLTLSASLIPHILTQNVHTASCSAATNFGNAVEILTFAVSESQMIAEAVLQTMRDFSNGNNDKATPMTYDDYIASGGYDSVVRILVDHGVSSKEASMAQVRA